MYRAGRGRHDGRVVHGPFPIRPGRLVGSAGALFVTLAFAWMGLQSQTLICRKQATVVCRADGFLTPDAEVEGTALRAVRVETQRRGKGKGTEYGTVVLETDRGSAKLLEVGADDARTLAKRIDVWNASGRPELREELHGMRWALAFAAVALVVALSLVRSALVGMGRIVLEIAGHGTVLRATRRIAGVPVGNWSMSLEDVDDVVVEWTHERDFWRSRGQLPRRLGRLVLVARGGARREVTPRGWAGQTLHLRAAAHLRALLGLEPVSGGVEDQLAAAERSPERPAWASNLPSRIGIAWLGACCGALAGVAVSAMVAVMVGVRLQSAVPGWLMGTGSIGGASAGIALALWLCRARVPR